jgi:hypothetical protein
MGPTGGASPGESTPCSCHYKGTLVDGTEFDSSYRRGQPTTFAPNQVVKGECSGYHALNAQIVFTPLGKPGYTKPQTTPRCIHSTGKARVCKALNDPTLFSLRWASPDVQSKNRPHVVFTPLRKPVHAKPYTTPHGIHSAQEARACEALYDPAFYSLRWGNPCTRSLRRPYMVFTPLGKPVHANL